MKTSTIKTILIKSPQKPSNKRHSTQTNISLPEKVPRPTNCFILYRRDKAAQIRLENQGITNEVMSKIASHLWKNESQEVKRYYNELAEIEKAKHSLQFPNYKYQPKRKVKKFIKNEYKSKLLPSVYSLVEKLNEKKGELELITLPKLNMKRNLKTPSLSPVEPKVDKMDTNVFISPSLA